jgi:hypothetical protein
VSFLRVMIRYTSRMGAVLLLIGLALSAFVISAPPVSARSAIDPTLCASTPSRLTVPTNFPLSVCFNGTRLTIKNTTDLMIDLRWQGTTGSWVRKADTTNAVSLTMAALDTLSYRLPPGYQATISVGGQAAIFEVELAPDENRLFWINLASSFIPGSALSNYQALSAFSDSMDSIYSSNTQCVKTASNFLYEAVCEADTSAHVFSAVQGLGKALLLGNITKTTGLSAAGKKFLGLVSLAINLAESDESLFVGNIQFSDFINGPKIFKISATTGAQTSPDSSRLAIGTQSGMKVWSAATGAVSAGSPGPLPVDIYNVNWSEDGRYLAWQQNLLSAQDSSDIKVVELDTRTGQTYEWPAPDSEYSGLVPGPDGVAAAILGAPQLIELGLNGSTAEINIPLPASAALAPYGDGFLAVESIYGGTPIAKVSTSGTVTQTVAQLPVIPDDNSASPFEEETASTNGQELAIEQGDHTDVCGVGPSSVIYTSNTVSGKTLTSGPPAPAGSAVRRVSTMAWSPSGVLDVTMFVCDDTASGNLLPTELWENAGDGWRQINSDVLSAARGPGGVLATVSGDLLMEASQGGAPESVSTGTQQVTIGNTPIALNAKVEDITWAP